MNKTSKQERAESNRQHHLMFFQDTYKEYPQRIANDLFAMAALTKRFREYAHTMKSIDQNRRENAFHMGVPLKESDAVYNWDEMLKAIPQIIESMVEYEKQFGVDFGKIRP